jgi:glutathione synthase
MTDSIYSTYPPELNPEQERFLVATTKDWAIHNGLTVRPSPDMISDQMKHTGVLATNAPVTLFPSPFPRQCFDEARAVQKLYNELYAAISSDEKWLGGIIKE